MEIKITQLAEARKQIEDIAEHADEIKRGLCATGSTWRAEFDALGAAIAYLDTLEPLRETVKEIQDMACDVNVNEIKAHESDTDLARWTRAWREDLFRLTGKILERVAE